MNNTPLQRIQFHQRRLLRADDLQGISAHEDQLRALHVTSVHNTWGVARGLDVWVSAENGQPVVRVSAGMAYDRYGRTILSTRTEALDLPAPRPTGSRLVHYLDLCVAFDESIGPADCYFQPARTEAEQPVFRWYDAGLFGEDEAAPPLAPEVRLGAEVPIARVRVPSVDAEDYSIRSDYSTRRIARALVRPYIATGQVEQSVDYVPEQRAWVQWISASDAGFTASVHYFVQLLNHPLYDLFEDDAAKLAQLRFIAGPVVSIASASALGFSLTLRFYVMNSQRDRVAETHDLFLDLGSIPLKLLWTGIQPVNAAPTLVAMPIFFINIPTIVID